MIRLNHPGPRSPARLFLACAASVCLAGLAIPSVAEGKSWPRPAAGGSSDEAPEVLFTFDDGPHERYTPMLLKTLDRYNIKAIFFWVGHRVTRRSKFLEHRKKLVGRAVREGHLVGNHTINHVHLCRGSAAEASREIDENQQIMGALTGMPMTLFRAPYGDHCERLLAMLAERKLQHMHWDVDPHEYRDHDSKRAAASVIGKLKRLRAGERHVVLMHDTKLVTARAMPIILRWLERENVRRRKAGTQPIRIISGSDVAAERLDRAVFAWTAKTAKQAVTSLSGAVDRVVPGRHLDALTRR